MRVTDGGTTLTNNRTTAATAGGVGGAAGGVGGAVGGFAGTAAGIGGNGGTAGGAGAGGAAAGGKGGWAGSSGGVDGMPSGLAGVAGGTGDARTIYVPSGAPTIMPMGDSITAGDVNGGYRSDLFQTGKYRAVGSITINPLILLPDPQEFAHHEGHSGQTSQYFVDNVVTIWAANPADIVLLMIGMNDAIAGTDPAITANNIGVIVDYIHARSPNTQVYLMGPTNAYSTMTTWNPILDQQRPNNMRIVAARGNWCHYIPMPHLADTQLDGGPHPKDHTAYSLLAAAIVTALP